MAAGISRRRFIAGAVGGAGLLLGGRALGWGSGALSGAPSAEAATVTGWIAVANIGTPQRYDSLSAGADVLGDTYLADWASDGTVYINSCDTSSWSGGAEISNLLFGKLSGDPSTPATLEGYDVNQMNGSQNIDFGAASSFGGSDGRTWKTCGLMALDGVVYLAVYRQLWDDSTIPWAQDASIITSTDYGANWVNHVGQANTPPPIGGSAMFPGGKYGLLDFIKYGQNGTAPAGDGADTYVSAYSPDCTVGLANHAQDLLLARCARSRISSLDNADWEYYTGGDGNSDSNWASAMSDAAPFWSSPCASEPASHGDLIYNAPLGRYILMMYAESGGEYRVYEGGHPWGPFYKVFDGVMPHDMRQPTMCTKYITTPGTTMWVLSSGWGTESAGTNYQLWTSEMDLTVATPGTWVDDSGLTYSPAGAWSSAANSDYYDDSVTWASVAGSSASYSFTGTSIQWIGGTNNHHGYAQVSIDGDIVAIVDTYSAAWEYQQALFSAFGLAPGGHTLEIAVLNQSNPNSTGYDTDIDAIVVGASTPIGAYLNDTDPAIVHSGSWTYQSRSGCYNSDLHYSNTPGDYIQVEFEGTSFAWMAGTADDHGKVDITVDGGRLTTIDTYSAVRTDQQILYTAADLAPGPHTVVITLRSDKNPASSNYYQESDFYIVGTY